MKINFPNVLVVIRILLVPIIVLLLMLPAFVDINTVNEFDSNYIYITDYIAGSLFLIASITDFIDGWWARKFNQISDFGKLFDPLADKVLVNTTLIIFGARGFIPIIFVLIFVCRDILVDGLRMMLASKSIVLAADKWGKLKTIFQMIGLTILYFIHYQPDTFFAIFDWNNWKQILIISPIFIALTFSIISGFNYYIKGFKQINVTKN